MPEPTPRTLHRENNPPKTPWGDDSSTVSVKFTNGNGPHAGEPVREVSSATDPLIHRIIDDWVDVSHDRSTDAFRRDLATLTQRDSVNGVRTGRCSEDLAAINKELTTRNLLPNMHLVGLVDNQVLVSEDMRPGHYGALATSGQFNEIVDADVNGKTQKVTLHAGQELANLGSISPDGIKQGGHILDCRFEAWLSSFSHANPSAIKNMIKDNHNGTYTVTFPGDPSHPQTVPAPSNLERDTFAPGAPEWDAIVGEAYRKRENTAFGPGMSVALHVESLFTGKPDALVVEGQNCNSGMAFSDDLRWWQGKSTFCPQTTQNESLREMINNAHDHFVEINPSDMGKRLQEALDQHMMLIASFRKDKVECSVARDASGPVIELHSGHAYSVLGYSAASQTVTLRNPWGSNDRATDGSAVGNGTETVSLSVFEHTLGSLNVEETS